MTGNNPSKACRLNLGALGGIFCVNIIAGMAMAD